jgi:transketolase
MDTFGASAPYRVLYEKYGIAADHVAEAAKALLRRE